MIAMLDPTALTEPDLTMPLAAVAVAFVHTALGPDHYLPFVALARARRWSLQRTLWVTGLCGLGHVASSLLLGGLGLAAGVAVGAIEGVEGRRGALAAWILFGLGVAYALFGVRRALRRKHGVVLHHHGDDLHVHPDGAHAHGHLLPMARGLLAPGNVAPVARSTGFWTLFLVFVLGPCEPLIPLFVVPASQQRWGTALVTGSVFAVVTLATMLAITAGLLLGVRQLRLASLQRWAHALAGTVIAGSAAAVLFLGA